SVTGALGGSILGRHMSFVPRVNEGRQLGKTGSVTAMIDLSDGLSRDLRNLCESSGVGAIIDASAVPIHEDAVKLRDDRSPLEHALHDGEDYELLFTTPAVHEQYRRIGQIVSAPESGSSRTTRARRWS